MEYSHHEWMRNSSIYLMFPVADPLRKTQSMALLWRTDVRKESDLTVVHPKG